MVDNISKLQNDVTGWLVCLCTQLLYERDIFLVSADGDDAESLVDDLDLCSL